MRNISAASLAKLSEKLGGEPINVVGINWNGTWKYYADKAYPDYGIEGRILELSALESVIAVSKNSNTQSLNLKLSDSDDQIKLIFDGTDIHKRPVRVYQWFDGIPFNEAFVIFEGKIGSPILWKEGERTLAFEVFTQIEDNEVGFSIEEGEFAYIPEAMIGQAWPLVFGTALEVPAIQVITAPEGTTAEPLGSLDNSSLESELTNHTESAARCIELFHILIRIAGALLRDSQYNFWVAREKVGLEAEDLVQLAEQQEKEGERIQDLANQYLQKAYEIGRNSFPQKIEEQKDEIAELQKNQLKIIGGKLFPQDVEVNITIGGVIFTGKFNGDLFTIFQGGSPFTPDDPIAGPTNLKDDSVSINATTELSLQRFFYAVGGSATKITGSYPIPYVACLDHCTILSVVAYRTVNNYRFKTLVPPSYYTVLPVTFGNLKATLVVFPKPLTDYPGQGWENDIWCNIVSPVGPNVVDVMSYLITTYTTKSIDATSFNTVKTHQNPYPVGFALTTRMNVTKLLQDLAFQSRSALYLKQDTFYLKYLPAEEAPVDTITETDVEFGTLEVTCDDTEDLITKIDVSWKLLNSQPKPNHIIYRYNVAKYGLHLEEINYYIYNAIECIQKSALFWLIRKANSWKKIKFSTFLTKLKLEAFDTVTLNFTKNYVANGSINAVVENCYYDSSSNRVELTCWVPVRFGEMTQYPFAFPAAIGVEYIFPQQGDPFAGSPNAQANTGEANLFNPTKVYGNNLPPKAIPHPDRGGFAMTDTGAIAPTVDFILDASEITEGQLPTDQGRTYRQYSIKDPGPQAFDSTKIEATYPGTIIKMVEDDPSLYEVSVYFKGFSKDPTTVQVRQLKIYEKDVIPPGTPCIVHKNYALITSSKGEDRVAPYYWMQVPVWLPKPDTEESNKIKDGIAAQKVQEESFNTGYEEFSGEDEVPSVDEADQPLGEDEE